MNMPGMQIFLLVSRVSTRWLLLLITIHTYLILILQSKVLVADAFHHVFTGTGALEVQLIASKLAIKGGDTCAIIGPSDEAYVKRCLRLMYGVKAAEKMLGEDNDDDDSGAEKNDISLNMMLRFVSDGESIGEELQKADGIIIICEESPMDTKLADTLLSNASNVQHVALLSKMGGAFKSLEDNIRKKCQSMSCDDNDENNTVAFSVIRAGILKGGGPGHDVEAQGGEEWGLSKHYYDTKYELGDAMTTMAFDQFTLGAKVSQGDPFKQPNFFQKIASKSSFEPKEYDTGRTAAAQALISAVRNENGCGVDVTISSEKGLTPPTAKEWDKLLDQS